MLAFYCIYFQHSVNIFLIIIFNLKYLKVNKIYLTNIGVLLEVLRMNAILKKYCASIKETNIVLLIGFLHNFFEQKKTNKQWYQITKYAISLETVLSTTTRNKYFLLMLYWNRLKKFYLWCGQI